jgi:hypothetical protein
MRYSLLSRFRGAFLGTVFGEILGAYGDSWQLGTAQKNQQPSSAGRLVVRGTEGLIRRGRLDLTDWCEAKESTVQEESEKCQEKLVKETNITEVTSLVYPGIKRVYGDIRAIISAVPVALFFHEDETKLRQNLQQVADVWQDDSVLKDGTLAIGYTLALALKEKLTPDTLIEQVIYYLDVETSLVQQLKQVEVLLAEGAGLETTLTTLIPRGTTAPPNTAVALAFYCFLSTIEDLQLSVMRAARCPEAQVTSAIAGALSGTFNSIAGVPVAWRLALGKQPAEAENSPLTQLWGLNSEAELLRLAARLLAAWSGVYNAEKFLIDPTQVPAIAAPKVIKPR